MKIFISHDVCKTPKDSLEGQREGENRGRETDGGRGGYRRSHLHQYQPSISLTGTALACEAQSSSKA